MDLAVFSSVEAVYLATLAANIAQCNSGDDCFELTDSNLEIDARYLIT